MMIALEGLEACGKTEQAEKVKQFFQREAFSSQVKRVKTFHFPSVSSTAGHIVGKILRGETLIQYPTDVVEFGRDLLNSADADPDRIASIPFGPKMDVMKKKWNRDKAIIIQSLMVSDRLEFLEMLAEFANEPDNLLVLDRYKMSGVAYGVTDGLDRKWLDRIQSALPDADLNIYVDISVAESNRRRPIRRDLYEANEAKLEATRDVYRSEFEERSEMDHGAYRIIAGEQSAEIVTEQIVAAIWERLGDFTPTLTV